MAIHFHHQAAFQQRSGHHVGLARLLRTDGDEQCDVGKFPGAHPPSHRHALPRLPAQAAERSLATPIINPRFPDNKPIFIPLMN